MNVSLFVAVILSPLATTTESWPDYRGPTHDGHVEAEGRSLPLTWSETDNVAWRTDIRGRGWSTPAIDDGRIWLTTATPDGTEQSVLCVDVDDGAILVDRVLFENEEPAEIHELNSYASPSPVMQDGRVYVHFGSFGTACLDAETGETLWSRRDLVVDHMVGPGSSPFLHDGRLVFHQDGGDIQYVIALDAETGETVWRTDRSVDYRTLPDDLRKAYDTPIAVDVDGVTQLVCVGAEATMGYAPDTGEELWRFRYSGFSMASRPVVAHGLVFLNTGFMKPSLVAVRLGGEGDVTDTHEAWRTNKSIPSMISPIVLGDHLYTVHEGGVVTCLDARTGERMGRTRLDGEFSASPILFGDRLYFANRTDTAFVLSADPDLDVLAENELDDGMMASPAVVGDALILRTRTALYRIQELPTDV